MPPSSDSERAFRRLLIVVFVFALLALIALGAYAGIRFLLNPEARVTSTAELPEAAATATAACSNFMAQFPGTPCPPVRQPAVDATATAACAVFRAQFPGTPCP